MGTAREIVIVMRARAPGGGENGRGEAVVITPRLFINPGTGKSTMGLEGADGVGERHDARV